MSDRAIYDTMVFYQWAALPPERSHATMRAVENGSIRLCLSASTLSEIRDLLDRPAIQARSPNLTPKRISQFLNAIREFADWFDDVPERFSLPQHKKDDHILNLAIESKARYLVTWETRLAKLATDPSPIAQAFRELTPNLIIVSPADLAARIKS